MPEALPDELAPGFDRLDGAITEVVGVSLDVLEERALLGLVDRLHRAQSRLAAERARIVADLERRRTRTIDDPGPRDRERQRLRRDLAERTKVAPSATKLDAQAGQAATRYRSIGEAFAAGEIGAEHVRLIAETLDAVADDDQRDAAEQHLLSIARSANPTVLGRHARELLARQAPLAADAAERRRHDARRMTAYDTPDGGFAFSGLLYGTAAETVRVAMNAFRTFDVPGEHRTTEQRGADAIEQLCATALRAGDARAQHGVRPHVLITVTTDQLELGETGIARLGSGQPVTLDQLRTVLQDCSWARVVLAPDGTPIEASETVRTVPRGLWRALLARDGGCTWPGCDAPASWCDVAHGRRPFTDGGRLAPDNATLLCRRHHQRFDRGGYRIMIDGNRVRFDPPGGTRAAAEERSGRPASGGPPRATMSPGPATTTRPTKPAGPATAPGSTTPTTARARPRRRSRSHVPTGQPSLLGSEDDP
jgi:hypothetical protein